MHSSTFYPAKFNANLGELSDRTLKEKHVIFRTNKNTKVAEAFARESSALHSHLLRLTDFLMALNRKMEDPNTRKTIHPIILQVLEHQRWVQALLSVSLVLLTTKAMLV